MKHAIIFLLMLVGCAGTPQFQPFENTDHYQIAETALRYLMDSHSNHGVEREHYSAYLIEGGEFTSQLVAAFADYKPRVVSDMQVSTETGGAIDKVTGKPVKLWSVKVLEVQGDRAVAAVTWYSGSLSAGGHTLQLRQKNGNWNVVSEKMDWIS